MHDLIYFLVKYIPFWAVPIGFLCVPFSYIYWVKEVKRVFIVLVLLGNFCGALTIYWLLAGGPRAAVHFLIDHENEVIQPSGPPIVPVNP